MFLRMVYDEKLAQAAYIIGCQRTGEALVVDPQRDVERYIGIARANGLRLVAAAETHIHADFVSGARELAERVGARVYLSAEGGRDWQYHWPAAGPAPAGQGTAPTGDGTAPTGHGAAAGGYDHVPLRDGDVLAVGAVELRAVHTPGHTPEHLCFVVTDRGAGADQPLGVLTGDFVFVGDLGRPDLLETAAGEVGQMEPSARRLYHSLAALDAWPQFAQLWPAHGAGSACGKALGAVPASTVGYEKRFNPALRAADSERGFVDFILAGQPEPPLYFARMKRVNRLGPAVLGAPAGNPPGRLAPRELRSIDSGAVAIVDTRPWEAFCAGHVPGSLSFPLSRSFPTDAGSMLAEDEDVVLIAEPGRLAEAATDLRRIGLDRLVGWVDASSLGQYEGGGHGLATMPEVDAREAAGMIDAGAARVLDVRRRAEFELGHMPGASNIAHTRLASRLAEVPRDRRLLVNCHAGSRSARASAYLRRMGFDAVNVRGGMLAWQELAAAAER